MTLILPRRKFITGLAALFVAPAIVRAENIMKIAALPVTGYPISNAEKIILGSGEWPVFTVVEVSTENSFIIDYDGVFSPPGHTFKVGDKIRFFNAPPGQE